MKTKLIILMLLARTVIAQTITVCQAPDMIGLTLDDACLKWWQSGFTNDSLCLPAQYCYGGHVLQQNVIAGKIYSCDETVLVLKMGQ